MCALVTGVQTCALPFVPRHPSQLYEAGLEGILLGLVLWIAFWKTRARYQPGKLVGILLLGYGLARFTVEFFRRSEEHQSELQSLMRISYAVFCLKTKIPKYQPITHRLLPVLST